MGGQESCWGCLQRLVRNARNADRRQILRHGLAYFFISLELPFLWPFIATVCLCVLASQPGLWAFGLVHNLRTSNNDERAQCTRESLGFTLSDPVAATLLLALAVPLSCVSVVTYAVAPIAIALTYPIATASILLSGLGPVWGISLFLILISAGVCCAYMLDCSDDCSCHRSSYPWQSYRPL